MNNEIIKLSQQILNYLKSKPLAGDTLEGIVTWWLEQDKIDIVVDKVAKALSLLTQEGEIRTHRTQSGPTIYKIKK